MEIVSVHLIIFLTYLMILNNNNHHNFIKDNINFIHCQIIVAFVQYHLLNIIDPFICFIDCHLFHIIELLLIYNLLRLF